MKTLFGMSQIRQYQIKAVLSGIYDTYRSKNNNRSFLISPESFTYILMVRVSKMKNHVLIILKLVY